jgi:hypothetical protein
MDYEKVNSDDAQSILYGGSPRTQVIVQPQMVQETKAPVAPPKKAKEEKKEGVAPISPTASLAQQVTNTMDVLKDNTPPPAFVSPVTPMTNTIGDLLTAVKNNWMPVAAVAAPALAYGAYKLGKNIVDGEPKAASPTTPISDRQIMRIEPKMDVNQQPPTGRVEPTFSDPVPVQPNVSVSPEVTSSTGYTGLAQLEEKHGVQFTSGDDLRTVLKGENNSAIKAGQEPPYPNLLSPEAQQKLTQEKIAGVTPSTSAPEAQTLVASREASLTPVEKVQEKIALQPVNADLRTGSGMPAIQGTAPPGTPFRKEVPSAANIPSTHAFVPGGQYMDIVRNAVGQDAYTASLLKSGGYPQTPEEAYSLSRMINESMSRMPRDVAKDLNIGLGDTTKAITQKVAGGKAVKLAGTAGALILMADLANAKTPQEKREAMRNLGEAILPPSMTSTEAGAPTLPPGAYTESRKLGSPFYKMFKEGAAPPSMR